ncbi:MAG: hypothetical protein ACREB9_01605 [Thermoplasmata archaeon]
MTAPPTPVDIGAPAPSLRMLPRPDARGARPAPSLDALLLLLSGFGYLLLLCSFVLVTEVNQIFLLGIPFPSSASGDRDLMALFGWVGMTISGVATIVVPGHFGVPISPRLLPRVHLYFANIGVLGFFCLSLLVPGSALGSAFLVLVSLSFLSFALGVFGTIAPFARLRGALSEPASAPDRRAASR